MLNQTEKAYYLALEALRNKEYRQAVSFFDRAAAEFGNDQEFVLLSESTRLLVAVKERLADGRASLSETVNNELTIEEVLSNGQKTDFPG
jgi:hypothetical protein